MGVVPLAPVLRNVSMFAFHAKIKASGSAFPCDVILMPVAIRFLALFACSLLRVVVIKVVHVPSKIVA